MVLDYVALGLLVFVALVIFYGIIVIHDIPYEIAEKRNHPHQDAIHVAGWVSLFTLHVIWPFLWIWATLYREDRGWGFKQDNNGDAQPHLASPQQAEIDALSNQVTQLQQQVDLLQQQVNATNANQQEQ